MMKMLYSSYDVRYAIREVFLRTDQRRVAVVAFVGRDAETYIPSPKGIELICWPLPGATNPNAVRKLMSIGVNVRFCDDLHMKVYWGEKTGAVVGSANLSNNALGVGGLHEAGIQLNSGIVDIDKLLAGLRTRKVTPEELWELDLHHRSFSTFLLRHEKRSIELSEARTFKDWYEQSSGREQWKIAWWSTDPGASDEAVEVAQQRYGVDDVYNYQTVNAKGIYLSGEWVLQFKRPTTRFARTTLVWLYVDFVIVSDKSQDELVQVLPEAPRPPFELDLPFIESLAAVLKPATSTEWVHTPQLSEQVLKRLLETYKHLASRNVG